MSKETEIETEQNPYPEGTFGNIAWSAIYDSPELDEPSNDDFNIEIEIEKIMPGFKANMNACMGMLWNMPMAKINK